jgi:hypothetical protein
MADVAEARRQTTADQTTAGQTTAGQTTEPVDSAVE